MGDVCNRNRGPSCEPIRFCSEFISAYVENLVIATRTAVDNFVTGRTDATFALKSVK
ncbi:hypothetical protein RCH23_003093 [Cryobacterium sp. CAN_C3]|nr:hypothetical protein [Cryobacterium sp. CAN_C3]